jgi:hypothetical protein
MPLANLGLLVCFFCHCFCLRCEFLGSSNK